MGTTTLIDGRGHVLSVEDTTLRGGLVIYADRVLLAELADVNQRMGQQTVMLLEHLDDGCLPAAQLDELGQALMDLGSRLRQRAGELAPLLTENFVPSC